MENTNDRHYNYNSYHSAKVIISAYLTAYIYDADIKTAVYDKFVDRLFRKDAESDINSPENEERKQIFNNCLYYFTSPDKKDKLDSIKAQIKQQPKDVGKSDFYDDLITEIVVLPAFAHAYTNGSDITNVYQKFEKDIPNDNTPQTIEKRQLLANCLKLFKNPRCIEELNTLRQQSNMSMADSEMSDIKFAIEISENFPEMLSIVSNSRDFAEVILPYFVHAYTNGYEIKGVFDKFQRRIPNDISKANADRRAVLENCLDFFQTAKTKETLSTINDDQISPIETVDDNGRPLSKEEISDRILSNFSNDICGNQRTKYDMSNLYSPSTFKYSTLRFESIDTHHSAKTSRTDDKIKMYSNNGDSLVIVPIGKLIYPCDAYGNESSVGQFAIKFESCDHTDIREAEVFTNIDFDKLDDDHEYYEAFIDEVFSKKNIERSNACGYIGELVDTTRRRPEQKPKVGQECEENGIYTYQASPKHALVYDYEPLSAVIDYVRRQEKNTHQNANSSEPKLKKNQPSTDSSGR